MMVGEMIPDRPLRTLDRAIPVLGAFGQAGVRQLIVLRPVDEAELRSLDRRPLVDQPGDQVEDRLGPQRSAADRPAVLRISNPPNTALARASGTATTATTTGCVSAANTAPIEDACRPSSPARRRPIVRYRR